MDRARGWAGQASTAGGWGRWTVDWQGKERQPGGPMRLQREAGAGSSRVLEAWKRVTFLLWAMGPFWVRSRGGTWGALCLRITLLYYDTFLNQKYLLLFSVIKISNLKKKKKKEIQISDLSWKKKWDDLTTLGVATSSFACRAALAQRLAPFPWVICPAPGASLPQWWWGPEKLRGGSGVAKGTFHIKITMDSVKYVLEAVRFTIS